MKTPPIIYNGQKYWMRPTGYWMSNATSGPKALHRAVWTDIHGPIPDGYHVHHRDGDRSNNAIENLECLPGGEHISRHKKGTTHPGLRGEACPTVRLTDAQVLEIRATYVRGRNGGQRALAEKYGVNQSTISFALTGRNWAHLEGASRPELAPYCTKGHPYTPENTHILQSGTRRCRTCFRAARSLMRARQRAERKAARLASK